MPISNADHLKAEIDELIPDLVAMRRDLHEHPELAFEEVRTSGIVAQRLRSLGLEVQTGIAKTGVIGLLRGEASQSEAKTLAIRADMDALPIQELNAVDYRSQVDGKMHACGHDGHTAILLAVADILSKRRAELKGNVKFIFQPAEESTGGAKPMVEQGALEDVDSIIGLHLISDIPLGVVGLHAGTFLASIDDFVLTIRGQGGHAASPHEAVDPIVIAGYLTTVLQTLISRETSPFLPAIITIGMIKAGTATNIIPETAEMHGTLRTFANEHREHMMQRIQEMTRGIASAMGGSSECEWLIGGFPPCTNDPAITALVRQAAIEAVGEKNILEGDAVRSTGGDDMAEFLLAVPGCYFLVGSRNEAKGTHYQHHHPRFDIDEDALPIGVEVLTRATLDFLK